MTIHRCLVSLIRLNSYNIFIIVNHFALMTNRLNKILKRIFHDLFIREGKNLEVILSCLFFFCLFGWMEWNELLYSIVMLGCHVWMEWIHDHLWLDNRNGISNSIPWWCFVGRFRMEWSELSLFLWNVASCFHLLIDS